MKRSKVCICLLQNAWGDREFPVLFQPNPLNKSAKVIRKMVGEDFEIWFCNSTPIVTNTANGRPKIDFDHMINGVIPKIIEKKHDIFLICGKQAEAAWREVYFKSGSTVGASMRQIENKMMIIPHPASRSLSNIQIKEIYDKINKSDE